MGVATQTAPHYTGETERITGYAYDAWDRLTRVDLPDGHHVSSAYGLLSETQTDEHGPPVTTRYDALGRKIQTQQTIGGQAVLTTYGYDQLSRLVSLRDAANNQWTWAYDEIGRNTSKVDPDAGTWSFVYDDAGRLTRQTDAKGQQTDFVYDAVGRLLTKTSGSGTVTLSYGENFPAYPNKGRVTSVTAPGTVLRSDYDALGRVVRLTRTLDGVDYTVERRYDAAGRLLGITYPDGDEVGSVANPLGYDETGRLTSIPGILTSVTYDAAGRPLVQTNGNGTVTTRSYSAERGFLTGIQTGSLQTLSYTNDDAGMVTQVTSPHAGEGWSYSYDALHRLTQSTNLSQPAETQSWSYDTIGRITTNSRIGTYSYGTTRPHAPVTAGVNSYSYDLNGNLTAGAGRTLAWDADNRITQVTAGGATTAFSYDGFGERLKKTSGGTTSLYPFGDDYEITNGVVTKYVSVEGLGVIAKRVTSGGVTQTYWLHTDRLGSVNAITDASGAEVYRKSYRPYGETLSASGNHSESRGWIDQRNDAETGLTYLHARYYDPQLGTFVSPDPLHPTLPGVGANRFSYGFDDPINNADLSGLECVRGVFTDMKGNETRWGAGECPTGTTTWAQDKMNAPTANPGTNRPVRPPARGGRGPGGGNPGNTGSQDPTPDPPTGCQPGDAGCNGQTGPTKDDPTAGAKPFAPVPPGQAEQLNANDKELGDAPEITFVVTSAAAAGYALSRSPALFGGGTWFNTGRFVRLGHSPRGRDYWFTLRGEALDWFSGRPGTHLYLWRARPRP